MVLVLVLVLLIVDCFPLFLVSLLEGGSAWYNKLVLKDKCDLKYAKHAR